MERHILLIDDDGDENLILQESIEHMAGVTASYANNPGNGIEILKAGLPDIVLMDLNMPGEDGLMALEKIKKTKAICHIPVFIYSTGAVDTYQKRAMELGAAGCLQKTTSHRSLHDLIIRILKLTEREARGVRRGKGSL